MRTGEVPRPAREYGITEVVQSPDYLGPDDQNPYGALGMFGYKSMDGCRADGVCIAPRAVDSAEITHADGKRELLFAIAGNLSYDGPRDAYGRPNPGSVMEPYRFVDLCAVVLFRMGMPAEGELPVIEHVLTYIHPGQINDVSIVGLTGPDGRLHPVALFAGADERFGGVSAWKAFLASEEFVTSSSAPSVGYLFFFPKGSTSFAHVGVSMLDEMPGGIRSSPRDGLAIHYRDPGDSYFGYRDGGVFHPFPVRDLTRWMGDIDHGHRIPPSASDLRSPEEGGISQVYRARLRPDRWLEVTVGLMIFDPKGHIRWEARGPEQLRVWYGITPQGEVVRERRQ